MKQGRGAVMWKRRSICLPRAPLSPLPSPLLSLVFDDVEECPPDFILGQVMFRVQRFQPEDGFLQGHPLTLVVSQPGAPLLLQAYI